jgi:hypothetical protein
MRGDTRRRATADSRSSIAVVAETEPLRPLPAVPYPVIVSVPVLGCPLVDTDPLRSVASAHSFTAQP